MDSKPTVFIISVDSAQQASLRVIASAMQLHSEVFESAEQLLQAFDPARPGCVVVDLPPEDTEGVEPLERLRTGGVYLPAIVISAQGSVPLAVRAMRAGAMNFLEKPCHEEQLMAAIQEAIAWDNQQRRQLAEKATVQQAVRQLTPGERLVLQMLMQGKSNREIAADLGLSVRTIEVRRAKLMRKMAAGSLAELVRLTLLAEDGVLGPAAKIAP